MSLRDGQFVAYVEVSAPTPVIRVIPMTLATHFFCFGLKVPIFGLRFSQPSPKV
jgi:hypothetical protein